MSDPIVGLKTCDLINARETGAEQASHLTSGVVTEANINISDFSFHPH